MARIVEKVGRCELRRHADPFHSLVGTVISQQISTKAAAAIGARLRARFARSGLTPAAILRATDASLRECGLSANKVRTIRALACRIHAGEIDLRRLPRQTEEQVAESLLPTPGIGPWSVHMFLMFGLARPDILPTSDYGIRVAVQKQFSLRKLPTPVTIERLAAPWRPYRTVASWYLWQSLK
jgi:DNA-3-methyladenine glycosylase II